MDKAAVWYTFKECARQGISPPESGVFPREGLEAMRNQRQEEQARYEREEALARERGRQQQPETETEREEENEENEAEDGENEEEEDPASLGAIPRTRAAQNVEKEARKLRELNNKKAEESDLVELTNVPRGMDEKDVVEFVMDQIEAGEGARVRVTKIPNPRKERGWMIAGLTREQRFAFYTADRKRDGFKIKARPYSSEAAEQDFPGNTTNLGDANSPPGMVRQSTLVGNPSTSQPEGMDVDTSALAPPAQPAQQPEAEGEVDEGAEGGGVGGTGEDRELSDNAGREEIGGADITAALPDDELSSFSWMEGDGRSEERKLQQELGRRESGDDSSNDLSKEELAEIERSKVFARSGKILRSPLAQRKCDDGKKIKLSSSVEN